MVLKNPKGMFVSTVKKTYTQPLSIKLTKRSYINLVCCSTQQVPPEDSQSWYRQLVEQAAELRKVTSTGRDIELA